MLESMTIATASVGGGPCRLAMGMEGQGTVTMDVAKQLRHTRTGAHQFHN